MSDKRILIIGGGFAGVHAAVGAARTLHGRDRVSTRVELVCPDPYLVIRPRLYESDLAGARVPLDAVLGPIGVHRHTGAVAEIDVAVGSVRLQDGTRLGYDQLVLAAGSAAAVPDGAHGADTYAQSTSLQERLRRMAGGSARHGGAVVVGGGFTGIELAAEIAGVIRASGQRVRLVEARATIAPEFGPRARAEIERALSGLGVELRTGTAVAHASDRGVTLTDGSRLDGSLVVWAAGPLASPLTGQVPGARDELGRLVVDDRLATGIDGVWAAGDSAAALADGCHVASMSCQQAIPQGCRAGENAAATILGQPMRAYRQPLYLTCLDLGGAGALLTFGFDRDTVLARGAQAKAFKRYINRSLIYPPVEATAEQVLAMGRPATSGRLTSALARLALRSHPLRARITGAAEDRAQWFAATERHPQPRPASAA